MCISYLKGVCVVYINSIGYILCVDYVNSIDYIICVVYIISIGYVICIVLDEGMIIGFMGTNYLIRSRNI